MDLFMTEVAFADFPAALTWFREVLRLPVLLLDEGRQFALLGSDRGRLALKGHGEAASERLGQTGRARLIFLVDDLDAERARLIAVGASVGDVIEDHRERYRSFSVAGPEGVPVRIFAWSDPARAHGPGEDAARP